MPGFSVSPLRMFRNVMSATPDRLDSLTIWALVIAARIARTSPGLGMFEVIAHATAAGTDQQPFTEGFSCSRSKILKPTTKGVLWSNVLALMEHHYERENLTRLARETRIGPGTTTRIKVQNTSVGIEVLELIADRFGVEPWQLLAPGLGVKPEHRRRKSD